MAVQSLSRLISNNRGMTLPTLMIFGVVGVLTVLSLSSAVLSSAGSTAKRGNLITYESYMTNIKNIVEEPGACTKMFRGKQFSNYNAGAGSKSTIDSINVNLDDLADHNDLQAGWQDPERSFGIDKIELEVLSSAALGSMRLYDPRHYEIAKSTRDAAPIDAALTYPVRVYLHPSGIKTRLSKLNSNSTSDSAKKAEINQKINNYKQDFEDVNPLSKNIADVRVFMNIDRNGVIQSCFGYQSDASVCAQAGGTYDFLNLDKDFPLLKCKPDQKCLSSPLGIVSHPSQCPGPYNYGSTSESIINIGKVNGEDRYMCLWCHPYIGDNMNVHSQDGSAGDIDEAWLEKEWQGLAQKVDYEMRRGCGGGGCPSSSSSLVTLIMEWEYLESVTIQSGLAVDETTEQYLKAQEAQSNYDNLKETQIAAQDVYDNIEAQVTGLQDELENIEQQMSDLNTTGENGNTDVADGTGEDGSGTEGASPGTGESSSNLEEMERLLAAQASKQEELNKAQANLDLANQSLQEANAEVAEAEELIASMEDFGNGEQTISEFLDPINQVREMLLNDFGIDESVINYMDAARGI